MTDAFDPFILLSTRVTDAAADMIEQVGFLTGIRRCRVPHGHEAQEMDDLRAAIEKAQTALAGYDACLDQGLNRVSSEQFTQLSTGGPRS